MLLKQPVIITPQPDSIQVYLKKMWQYRSLIWVFAWQEIRTQYAQTYFGVLWAVIRPLFILAIFTVLFNYLLKIQTTSPYYLFAFTGMLAWNYFQQIATSSSAAISQKQGLIRKMYFPKLVLPLSKVIVASVEMLISLALVFVMLIWEGQPLTAQILTLPLFLLLNIICGLLIGLWMNGLNIRYRDLNQIVMPLISIGIWFTPVFFPVTIIPQQYHFLLYLNPLAGVISGYRYALLNEAFPESYYWIGLAAVTILSLAAAWYLIRVEDEIVDYA